MPIIGTVLAVVALGVIAAVRSERHRAHVARALAIVLSTATMGALSLAPTAGAASPQFPISITNSVLSAPVGTTITLNYAGGSGTGKVTFKATGTGCKITTSGSINKLSDSAPGTCSVVATKAASGTFLIANSAAVVFTFLGKPQAKLVAKASASSALVGATVTLSATGGTGKGKVTFSVTGTGCEIISTNKLRSTAVSACSVVATKPGTGAYATATSAAVVVNFIPSTFQIVNTVHSGTAGTPITVLAEGGTVAGTPSYSVTGTNCSINASTGVLSASDVASCVVTAKLYAGMTLKATAPTVTFTFAAAPNNPTVQNPDVATLTGVTGTHGSQIDDTANGKIYFINQYYNNNDHWYGNYIDAGATVTLTWHVTGSNGRALPNAPVTLRGNLGYSNSAGVTWQESSLNQYPGGGPSPEGTLGGTTDANGNVTFTLHNLNTETGPAPSDLTTTAGMQSNEGPFSWTAMLLQVGSDVYTGDPATTINQGTDRVDLIVIPKSGTLTAPTKAHPDVATLTSLTGTLNTAPLDCTNTANACDGRTWFLDHSFNSADHWYLNYVPAGGSVTETWHVVDYNGNAMKNQAVTLVTNHEVSADGAKWTATGIDGSGYVSGTTDSSGNVSFTLTNSDSATAGAAPTNTTTNTDALAYENAGNPAIRTVLIVGAATSVNGSDSDAINAPTANQATDFVDLLVVPTDTVATQTSPTKANPDVATLTSITGTQNTSPLDCTNTPNTCDGRTWFLNQSFNSADHWYLNYVPAGGSVTETWHVVDFNGNPMKDQVVTLIVNHEGKADGANWTATGISDGTVSGTTDSKGDVSFTLTNSDASTAGGTPANTNDAATALAYENAGNPAIRQVLIIGASTSINGSATDSINVPTANQATDFVDLLVTRTATTPPPAGPTKTKPDVASLTSITGGLNATPIDCTNIVDVCDGLDWFLAANFNAADHWNMTYVAAGSSVTETWHVTDYNGDAMKNQAVTLVLDHDGWNSSTWSATGLSNGLISGTTDSSGNVSFTLTNTNAAGSGTTPANTTNAGTALAYSNAAGTPRTRTLLIIGDATTVNGSATDSINGSANQATDFVDLLVTP